MLLLLHLHTGLNKMTTSQPQKPEEGLIFPKTHQQNGI
jgi:hypothetical protein